MTSKLILHCGAEATTRDQIATIPTPAPIGPRHQPVAHGVLLDSLCNALDDAGLQVAGEEYGVAREGAQLFGLLQVEPTWRSPLARLRNDEHGFALGVRSANDGSLAIRLAAGAHVFVCDNLCFGGQHVLRKLHTTGLQLDVELRLAVSRYVGEEQVLVGRMAEAKRLPLTDDEARVEICRVFEAGVLPGSRFSKVTEAYFGRADGTGVTGSTAWGLHNAFTWAIRDMRPRPKYDATLKLAGLLPEPSPQMELPVVEGELVAA